MSKDEMEPMGGIVEDPPPIDGDPPLDDPELFGLLAWNNVIDQGTVRFVGTGVELTPITNLQDRRLAKSYRLQPFDSFSIFTDLAEPSAIRLVAVNVNAPRISQISGDGLCGAILYDAFSNPIAEVTVRPIPIQGEGEFFPAWLFFDFGQHYEGVVSIEVQFITGWQTGPGGVVDLGRLWASYGLSVPGGFDAGWSQQASAPQAKIKRSRSGQAYVRPSVAQRTTSFSATNIDEEDVLLSDDPVWRPTVQQAAMQTAAFEECIALIRTSSSSLMQSLGVYGSLVDGVSWRHETATFYTVEFKHFEER